MPGEPTDERRLLLLHDIESYLEERVRPRFRVEGYLSAFDFFCIVIWKANRAKSKIARRLIARAVDRHEPSDLDSVVKRLTVEISTAPSAEARLAVLIDGWAFRLPMATAILTILYPDEFTVYDVRVCSVLGTFGNLAYRVGATNIWPEYCKFVEAVKQAAPSHLSLRDKDRYLWGQSFEQDLRRHLDAGFADVQHESATVE